MHDPAFPAWLDRVRGMPAERQLEEVRTKLTELNPGFDGLLTGLNWQGPPEIKEGAVKLVGLNSEFVKDLSPLRALDRLHVFGFRSPDRERCVLTDLTPLRGLKLTSMFLIGTPVVDLGPLEGMPLKVFHCEYSAVRDLRPICTTTLEELGCAHTTVTDVSPLLACTKLKKLDLRGIAVPPADIAKLEQGLPDCEIDRGEPAK